MKSTNTQPEPNLAAPGAGLPKVELFITRLIFNFLLKTGNRDSFDARFQKERALIRRLVNSCDAESAAQRVLIKRPRGLEDSSRNWSVWMTLEHLRIVHTGIQRIVGVLIKGIVPEGKLSIANVKPSPDVTADVVAAYEESCDALLATVAAIPNLSTTAHYAHPWFGPLDAAGWHALAGIHLRVHRVQIERIVEGINKDQR